MTTPIQPLRRKEAIQGRMVFPEHFLRFPRDEWQHVTFVWPVFMRGEIGNKSIWAGREASKRWTAAFQAHSLEGLQDVDVALAVFDKTCHLNEFARGWQPGAGWVAKALSTPQWIDRVETLIDASYRLAEKTVLRFFPNDPATDRLFAEQTRDMVIQFCRRAMMYQWTRGSDSCDSAPQREEIDEARFLDPFLPKPEELPPRRLIKADPYGEYPDAPEHIWLDSAMRLVDPPVQPTTQASQDGSSARPNDAS